MLYSQKNNDSNKTFHSLSENDRHLELLSIKDIL